MQFLNSVLWFVVAIGVLVTVHEFGHFWVARRLGVKVLRFSVGFGRPIWRRVAGADRTEYVLAAIPLGGYVRMLDETEDEVPDGERHRAFNRQSLATRSAVVVAGPLANFLFAIAAYTLMFMLGVSGLRAIVGDVHPDTVAAAAGLRSGDRIVAVQGREVARWETAIQAILGAALDGGPAQVTVRDDAGVTRSLRLDLARVAMDDLTQGQFFTTLGLEPRRPSIPARIGGVVDGMPAARSGLRPGDLVLSAGGTPITDWSDWVQFVRARAEQPFAVQVERDGVLVDLSLTPVRVRDGDEAIGQIGALPSAADQVMERFYAVERFGPWEALTRGAQKTVDMSLLTLRMFGRMITGDVSLANLSGPISIGQYAGVAADRGFTDFLYFLGVVSIGLGILNLLPVPLLDGGHLLYYAAEFVLGRPLSEAAQYAGQRVGIALLVGLMGLAFYNDLSRLFG